MTDNSSDQDVNPYAPPGTWDADVHGQRHLVHELSIKFVGLLCLPVAFFTIASPDSMNWIVGPFVRLMYSGLRDLIPRSLLMLLPYFLFGVSLILVARLLLKLNHWGRIGCTVVCCIGLMSFPTGTSVCVAVICLLWSPQSNVVFSGYKTLLKDQN